MDAPARPRRSTAGTVILVAIVALGIVGVVLLSRPVDIVNNNDNSDRVEAPSEELAKLVHELDRAPHVDDATLNDVLQAVLRRAHEGDVSAAAFVFRLAQQQRERDSSESSGSAGRATTVPTSKAGEPKIQ